MAFFELIMEDFSTEDVSQDATQEPEPISWMDTEEDSSSEAGRTPIGGLDVEGDSSRD